MPLTVREMLQIHELKGIRVLGGEKGLGREINKVTVMDAPDIAHWLHGGEFLITTAYIFRETPLKLKQLIEDINQVNAAALGIKVNRFINEIPKDVIDTSNSLDFPLLHIPVQFTFPDVFNPIILKLFHKEKEIINFSESIHRSFFEIIVRGEGIDDILSVLSRIIRIDTVFYEMASEDIYINSNNEQFRKLVFETPLIKLIAKYPARMISSNNNIYGYLIFDSEKTIEFFDIYKEAIDDAVMAMALCIQKRISSQESQKQYKCAFVHDLLSHNVKYAQEVWDKANIFGWDFPGFIRVIMMDIDNATHYYQKSINSNYEILRNDIFNIIISNMESKYYNIPYVIMSDSVVFILSLGENKNNFKKDELCSFLTDIKNKVFAETRSTISVGLGGIKESVFQCHESFDESRKAVLLARSIAGNNTIMFWDDSGIYKILSTIYDNEDSKNFYKNHLGKLIVFDANNKSYPVMQTLECLVKNDWSLSKASKAMYIHYNTMKYRAEKICEMLECDINNHDDRVNIWFSLILYYMNKRLGDPAMSSTPAQ